MSFRITLDGQNLGDPQEWRELAIVSEWSDDIFTTTCSNTFTFAGEAYEYLIDLYDSAYCSVVVARIYVCDDLVHEGRLYLSEATIDRRGQGSGRGQLLQGHSGKSKLRIRRRCIEQIGTPLH